jgi:F-type H+-transporting ATPase subunit b
MKELGIEPMLLLAQIVNFAIIFFVLKKFLYKPVLTMIEKRKREIDEGLETARKIQEEEEKAKERKEKILTDAKKEARAIVDEAKKLAEEQKKQILADAHKEAGVILAKAKAQAESNAKALEEQMKRQSVDLAALMVQKLLPEVLSDADHKKVIAAQLKALQTSVKQVN